MVDHESIRRRLQLLQDSLADLRRYRQRYDARTISMDRDVQHMVLHAMYVAAQAAIDIALHAAAAEEQPTAATYQQAFSQLASAGRITPELASRMMGWAGLRNVLAHYYATIDHMRIAQALANDLQDLEDFAATVAAWT